MGHAWYHPKWFEAAVETTGRYAAAATDTVSDVIAGRGLDGDTGAAGQAHAEKVAVKNTIRGAEEKATNPTVNPIKVAKFPLDLDSNRPVVTFEAAPGDLGAATIALPIPTSLEYSDAANYGETETNFASAGQAARKDEGAGFFGRAGGAIADVGRKGVGVAKGFVGGAMGGGKVTGKASNKNIITEFNEVSIRSFQFQYKFMPMSVEESNMIRNIQYAFQARTYPTVDVAYVLLKYPPTWTIKFHSGISTDDLRIPGIFEKCYLKSCTFTINPSNNSWMADLAPGEVDLNLTFIEGKALTAEDIIPLQYGSGNEGDNLFVLSDEEKAQRKIDAGTTAAAKVAIATGRAAGELI